MIILRYIIANYRTRLPCPRFIGRAPKSLLSVATLAAVAATVAATLAHAAFDAGEEDTDTVESTLPGLRDVSALLGAINARTDGFASNAGSSR